MKDWKAECDKLRGENKELREHLRYEREKEDNRVRRLEEYRDKFKDLIVDVLGSNL